MRKQKITGLFTPNELNAAEALLFGPDILRAAFLLRDASCRSFYDWRSRCLRQAGSAEEAQRVGAAIVAERDACLELATHSPRLDARSREHAERSERALLENSKRRAADGLPALYDRRGERWVEPGRWSPMPFVDAPEGQVFHTDLPA